MTFLDPVGFLAGFLVAVALAPQVIKAWKTKSTKDISMLWNVILMAGLILWVIYAIVNTILPLSIFALVEFLMAFSLFLLKVIYK